MLGDKLDLELYSVYSHRRSMICIGRFRLKTRVKDGTNIIIRVERLIVAE